MLIRSKFKYLTWTSKFIYHARFDKNTEKRKSGFLKRADYAWCSHDKYQSSLISCTRTDALLTRYREIYISVEKITLSINVHPSIPLIDMAAFL